MYTVVVRNQGSGADENIKVMAELPEQFEFVSARGPGGEVKADGKSVNLGVVKKLEPKEKVEWHLRVKAKEQADVRMKVELTSDYLQTPVPEVGAHADH
ncbi:MAG: hypothetical protein HC834_04430 [Rhodospirillales bacterium]|nr:hypothetical protein [Rhodospirillales bacterium]